MTNSSRLPVRVPHLLVLLAVCTVAARASAGTLTAVAPSGATPGITIQISGTGLSPVAAQNQITFLPAAGSPQTLPATSATILDAATGRGRVLVRVPAGLPVGAAALRVTNLATGETSEGRTLQVLEFALGDVRSAYADGSTVDIELDGSPNTLFVAGATRVVLGADITVNAVTVESPTRLRASVTVARTAALGPRAVAFNTSQQMGTLPDGFVVRAGGGNMPPFANANGPYSGLTGADIAFSSAGSSDPEGDPIRFAWTFGDGGSSDLPNPTHRYNAPGTYDVVLTVSDNRGNSRSDATKATIASAPNREPAADAWGPYSGLTGQPVAFSGLGSTDPDGDLLIFAWDFGDGLSGIGPSPDHVYGQPGIYTVTLLVSDGRGGADTARTIARVSTPAPGNQPPRAAIGGPYTVVAAQPLTLSAAGSSDPDNDTLAYAWSFGDGEAGTGVSPQHTYQATGTYTATVLVTDGRGGSDTAQAEVVVTPPPAPQNQPPIARAGADTQTKAGVVVRFDGSASNDPDGDPLTLAWSFGDGASAEGPTPDHAYSGPGVYTVTLLVTDGRGGAATDTLTVSVTVDQANRPPAASINGPSGGAAGEGLAYSAVASDPDNDPLTYAWDFENGTGDGAAVTHAWQQAGTYTVTLTVTDGRGGIATATQAVTITAPPTPNSPPIADAGGPYAGEQGVAIALDGSGSGDPDNDPLTFAWSFGDSTTGTGAKPSHAYAQAGSYTVTLVVTDTKGATSTGTAQVVVSGTAPRNRAPIARPGGPYTTSTGIGVPFDGTASSDPDGDALTFSWDFGDQSPKGSGPSPVHAYAAAGVYTVTLTVTDPSGASDGATASVSISAPADRSPPNVTLSAPKFVLPGAQVTVTAKAVDDVAVSSVRFEVENDAPSDTSLEPYQRTFSVPALATPGQTILVRAVARDPSNNTGQAEATVTVTVLPDTEPPVVALTGPPQTTAGASMRLVASATDNVGVAGVTFFAGSDPIDTVQTPPYEVVYAVPPGVTVGTQLPFTARAVDFSGNAGAGSTTVPVVGTPDQQPPQVALTAPARVSVGALLKLSAVATDDVGVASVTFYVNGVPVATDTQAPYETEAAFPAGTNPGGVIAVSATAVDFANLSASDGRSVLVVAPPAISRGVIAGEVYDDTTGLPLAGATVTLGGRDLQGRSYDQQTTTDARGRYLLRGNEGNAVVIVTKTGWTRVDRPVAVMAGRAIAPFDARLTPLATAVSLSPITGGQAGTDAARIEVPVAALQAPASIAVTSLSQQGLQGLLPAGWTPVGAVDVTPHGLAFTGTAALRLANGFALPQGTVLTIATWDESGAAWRVVSTATIGADGGLAGEVPGTGQFAWLLADGQPLTPPSGVGGAWLAGVDLPVVPDPVDTVVTPQPKVLFYQPGVHSDVRTTITAPAPLSSGARVWARITETYSYYSGGQANPDPFVEDLVFYQVPSTPTVLAADYPVGPSLTFEALSLEQGVIGVDAYVPATGDSGAQLVASDGGVVAGPGGESLVLPPGAVADATPFDLATLTADRLGITLPAELSFAGGVEVKFTGALGAPASLAVPRPQGYTNADATRTLLVRLQELGGQTRLVLVGLARLNGDALASDLSLGGQITSLEGVRVPGRYLFVRMADSIGPIGFAGGQVVAIGGGPFAGALVSGGLPVVSLSRTGGAYFAVGRAGATTFTATDLAKFDEGTATTTVLAARAVPLDIALAPQPPRVTSLTPANDAVAVPLSDALVAVFSEPIDPATATPEHVQLVPAGGDPVAGSIALSSGNTKLTFRAATPLAPATTFTFTLTQGLRDLSGYGLDRTYETTFTSLDTNPPPPPPAGSLNATIPDENGESVVTGTQGTAGVHDRVFILNVTKGSSTPALIEPNGSFRTVVQAGLKDKLRIQIVGPGGSETLADVGLFRNPDGSVAVPPEGGSIWAANGLRLDVPEGAFPDGAVVKFSWVPREEVPVEDPPDYPLVAAFEVNASVEPQKYLNVSVPPPDGWDASTNGIVAEYVTIRGIPALAMVDTAKMIDGRLQTSSPPCPGIVQKFARYGVYLNDDEKLKQFGIGLLSMTIDRVKQFTVDPIYLATYATPATSSIFAITPLTPPITFDIRFNPVSRFITRINEGTWAATTNDPLTQLTRAALTPTVCMFAPADQPVRVVVTSANTGAVITSIPVTAPPAGTPLEVNTNFVSPRDPVPPQVIWTPWDLAPPHVLDQGEPIVVVFSEPVTVDPASPVTVEDTASHRTIAVTTLFRNNNRVLIVVPASPLPMGGAYELRMPGVRDLAGNPLQLPAGASGFPFTTFKPYVVQPSATGAYNRQMIEHDLVALGRPLSVAISDLSLRDVDFISSPAEDNPSGQSQTTLFGVGRGINNQLNLIAVDVTSPERPKTLAAFGPSARWFQQLRLFPATSFPMRAGGVPKSPVDSAWSSRVLTYVDSDPQRRICTPGADPFIATWQARQLAKTPGITFGSKTGCGDLAVATSYNTSYGILHLYDVFSPGATGYDVTQQGPVGLPRLAQRLLSDNGPALGFPRKNEAPPALGWPRAFTLVPGLDITHCPLDQPSSPLCATNSNTLGAFVANEGVGLELVDVQRNFPDIESNTDRPPAGTVIEQLGYYSFPYYVDVEAIKGTVYALASDQRGGSGIAHIEMFGLDLAPGSLAPLDAPATAMAARENVQLDTNGDGTPESFDFLYVAGTTGTVTIYKVDASVPSITPVGRVPTPSAVTRLRHIDVDPDARYVYVSANWTETGLNHSGVLMIDAVAALGLAADADGDGWDDRIVARIPVTGTFTQVPSGEVVGLRVDEARGLLYAAIDDDRNDAAETPLAIIRTCRCLDQYGKVTLKSANTGPPLFPPPTIGFASDDGSVTTVLVAPQSTFQYLYINFESDIAPGLNLDYQITELPFSNDPADTLLDLSGGAASGSFNGSQIRLIVNPINGYAPPTRVLIDFRTTSGTLVKQAMVVLTPAFGVVGQTTISSSLDRINRSTCDTGGFIPFFLSHEGRVTLKVDGAILPRYQGGIMVGLWQDVLLPPGMNAAYVTRTILPSSAPGDHQVGLTVSFSTSPNVAHAATGVLTHEVQIHEALPVGQTFMKGVGIKDGNLTIQRTDLAIGGLGPLLTFSRSYSSAGNYAGGTMGAGWTHNWEARLVKDGCGTVTVIGGDGTGTRFSPASGGAYKPQQGNHGTLTYDSNADSWDFYSKHRTRYHYERQPEQPDASLRYRLAFVEDTNANRLTLSYRTAAPFLLDKVTDVAGRTLEFSYGRFPANPAALFPTDPWARTDRVTRVTGPLDLDLSFEYDDFGNLVKATRGERAAADPTGPFVGPTRSEGYEYSVTDARDRHNLRKVVGPNNPVTGGDITEYAYYQDTDAFPGESPTFQWGTSILVVPQKYELIKSVVEGAGSADEAITGFAYDYSQRQTGFTTTLTDPRTTRTVYSMNALGNQTEERVILATGDIVTRTKWATDETPPIPDIYITEQTDPNGRVAKFRYDANGNMIEERVLLGTGASYAAVTDATGNSVAEVVTTYDYDPVFSKQIRKTDPEDNVVASTIDPANGNVLTTTSDPRDGTGPIVVAYEYYGNGQVKTVTDPRWNVTRYDRYDTYGNPEVIVDGAGVVTTNTYDARGRLRETSDSRGRRTAYVYDALDRAAKVTKYAGRQPAEPDLASADHVQEFTYFPSGDKRTVKNGLGNVTSFELDALNRPVLQTNELADADGARTTLTLEYGYDGNGNKTREIDRRRTEYRYTYDRVNRLEKVEVLGSPALTLSSMTYDAVGNKLTDTDLHGHTTQSKYDRLYRVVETVLPLPQYSMRTQYDRAGNILRTTDPNGNAVVMTYDGVYRLRSRTDALGNATTYEYDKAGNKVAEVNVSTGLRTEISDYDGLNRPGRIDQRFNDPLGGQAVTLSTTVRYLDADNAKEITNPRRFVTREQMNGLDEVIEKVVDTADLALRTVMAYDGMGNVVATQDPEGTGADLVTTYDGAGRPIKKVYRLGAEERVYYDGNSNIVKEVDRRGVVTRHRYDALNRRTDSILEESITNGGADLVTSHVDYDDAANTVTATNANGRRATQTSDAMHRILVTTDAADKTIVAEWDGVNKRAETDRRGFRREFDYDALSRMTEVREMGSGGTVLSKTTTEYRDRDLERIDTDRTGVKTVVEVDPLQRIRRVSREHPDLAASYGAARVTVETTEYDGNGNKVAITDANGHVRRFAYDGAERRFSQTEGADSPVEATTSFTYDKAGRILTVKDGRAHGGAFDWRYTYDERYRKTNEEDGEGNVRTFTYDQADNLLSVTDPLGVPRVTSYEYDEAGNLISADETRGGAGGVTRQVYDAARNRIAQQDASGNLTTFAYNANGRATDTYQHREAGSAGVNRTAGVGGDLATARHLQSDYDANGNETLFIDAAGQTVAKTYDYLNRLVKKEYGGHQPTADGRQVFPRLLSVSYGYDGNGNLLRTDEVKQFDAQSDPVRETTEMRYDRMDRLVERRNPDGKVVRHGYDRAGNRLSVTDADGTVTSYTFDARNRLETMTTALSSGTGVTRYAWFANGLPRSVTYPNGVVSENAYDRAGRLTSVTNHAGDPANPISSFAYTYDANGSRLTQTERQRNIDGGAADATSYQYDGLNRITAVTYGNGASIAYTYAPNGDRLTEIGTDPTTLAAVNRQYEYNRLGELVRVRDLGAPADSRLYAYDANGNTVRQATGTLDATGDIPAPVRVQAFDFDVRDQMAAAGTLDGTGQVTFDYDFAGRRVKMRTPFTNIRFLYDQSSVLQEYDGASLLTTLKYNYGNALVSVVTTTAGGRRSLFYSLDALGSTANLTAENGAIEATYRYDLWGGLRKSFDTTPNRRLFTGHYFDSETGLHYFGARYYDDRTGRFLSQDPFAGKATYPPSLNRYTYAFGSPATYVDPDGRIATIPLAIGGAVLGGIGGCIVGALTETGCLKGAAVGAATLGLAGLTFGLSAAAFEGAFIMSSTWVPLTAATAVGSYTFGAGGVLADGGSLRDAHTVGSVEAFFNTAPMLLGPVGEAFMAPGSGQLARMAVWNFAENYAVQKIGVAVGAYEQVDLSQAVANAAFPLATKAAGATFEALGGMSLLKRTGGLAAQAEGAVQFLMRERDPKGYYQNWIHDFRSKVANGMSGADYAGPQARWGTKGRLTVGDAWKLAGYCMDGGGTGCDIVGGFRGSSWTNLVDNVVGTLKGEKSQARGWLEYEWRTIEGQTWNVPKKFHGDIDLIKKIPGQEFMNDAGAAARLNGQMTSPMFDNVFVEGATKHGIMGEHLPLGMIPEQARLQWWAQEGLEVGSPIVAIDYWKKGVEWEGRGAVAPFYKGGSTKVTVRNTDPNLFSVNAPSFDAAALREIAGSADAFGGRVFATTIPSLVNK